MTLEERQILELFRESGAMLEGHFELSSGKHSDRFFQCALVLSDPKRAEQLARALAQRLAAETDARIDVVVGPALGAMIWAHEVARAIGVRCVFTERKDGVMSLRRGFTFARGERALVVEDVLTTGGSVREVLRVVRDHGAEPVRVGALINRTGGNPFEEDGLELTALAEVQATAWERSECPLCASGDEAVKPGSRPGEQVGGPAA